MSTNSTARQIHQSAQMWPTVACTCRVHGRATNSGSLMTLWPMSENAGVAFYSHTVAEQGVRQLLDQPHTQPIAKHNDISASLKCWLLHDTHLHARTSLSAGAPRKPKQRFQMALSMTWAVRSLVAALRAASERTRLIRRRAQELKQHDIVAARAQQRARHVSGHLRPGGGPVPAEVEAIYPG